MFILGHFLTDKFRVLRSKLREPKQENAPKSDINTRLRRERICSILKKKKIIREKKRSLRLTRFTYLQQKVINFSTPLSGSCYFIFCYNIVYLYAVRLLLVCVGWPCGARSKSHLYYIIILLCFVYHSSV